MGRKRDLERVQRLLRRIDLEEVLEDLGIEILYFNGPDAYAECPDPEHEDANPSFHVCVDDVTDDEGRSRLGWFNCWSHPDEDSMRGVNFLDLVAKIRFDLWGERDDGRLNWPTEEQRSAAAAWLRKEYLRGDRGEAEVRVERSIERRRAAVTDWRELLFPPSEDVAEAESKFLEYLERREITAERAAELRVKAVRYPGASLKSVLADTCPGVLFPIPWEGRDVNWFVRGINKRLASRFKGRYCPGLPLGKGAGVLWAPDGIEPRAPVVLVEGIFDAERVRAIVSRNDVEVTVAAVLGGRLYPAQAKHLRAASHVIHLADGDSGGDTLGKSIEEQLGRFTRVAVRRLPDGEDPGDAEEEVILRMLKPPENLPRVRVRFRSAIRR